MQNEEIRENNKPNVTIGFFLNIAVETHLLLIGVIYGSNSCPVRIRDIEKMISGTSPVGLMFANKPKAIIVQACQGTGRLTGECAQ